MDSIEERLAVVETKIDTLKEDVDDLKHSMETLCKTVKNELRHITKRVNNLEIEIHERKARQEYFNNWIKPIILSIIVTLLTLALHSLFGG